MIYSKDYRHHQKLSIEFARSGIIRATTGNFVLVSFFIEGR